MTVGTCTVHVNLDYPVKLVKCTALQKQPETTHMDIIIPQSYCPLREWIDSV